MPKISGFEPKAGHHGDYVTIVGENFGDTPGEVLFGDEEGELNFPDQCLNEVWQDDQVIIKVPAALASGSTPPPNPEGGNYVITLVTNEGLEITSGPDEFYVGDYCADDYLQCGIVGSCAVDSQDCVKFARPGLCKIQPDNGFFGTPVSFYGENFGATTGKAKFIVSSGLGEVVPAEWTIGGGDDADQAEASVPEDPLSGKIKIISAAGLESNGIQFDASDCAGVGDSLAESAGDSACPGAVCCGEDSYYAGSCMSTEIECGAGLKDPTDYIWTFTTQSPSDKEKCAKLSDQILCEDQLDAVDCCWENLPLSPPSEGGGEPLCRMNGLCSGQTVPYVIEECGQKLSADCVKNAGAPSPSPWIGHNEGEACVDSKIMARFSEKMNTGTFTGALKIKQCETCDDCVFNETMCGAVIAGVFSNDNTNFEFNPVDDLETDTWYQVVLDGALITSENGIMLDGNMDGEPGGNYKWTFKTRQDATVCTVDCPVVDPGKYTSNTKDEKISYVGSFAPEENKCSLLKDRGGEWNWASDDDDKAEIVDDALCNCLNENNCGCVSAKNETEAAPVKITGVYENKSDFGLLTIDFADFKVVDYGPNCEYACLNAQVWVTLNSELNGNTVNANNISLYKCEDESCGTYTVVNSGGTLAANTVIFNSPISLNADTSYRAIMNGGQDGIRNVAGGTLSALNYRSSDKNQTVNYSFEADFGWELNGMNRVSDKVHTGEYAIVADAQDITASSLMPINVVAGKKYGFSGWIYNSLEQGKAYIDVTGYLCDKEAVSVNWNNAWEKVECEFIAAETKDLTIYLNVENGQGHVWFDDIEFREINGVKDSFSWVFKTSDQLCEVNRVEVEPLDGKVTEIGQSLLYSAAPYATPDKCDEEGQKLNALSYDWAWAENPSANWASISDYPRCGNGFIEYGEECEGDTDLHGLGTDFHGCDPVTCLNTGTMACVAVDELDCCGNGKVETGEECDGEDWCSDICLNKGSNTLYGSSCGNGILEYGEDCESLLGHTNQHELTLMGGRCDVVSCLNTGTFNEGTGYSPYQLVTADDGPSVGESTATVAIEASTETKTGEGDFTIMCGYEYGGMQDHKCNEVGLNEKGVALNGCCGTRPTVIEPIADLADFCLNGTVEVVFDQIMDEGDDFRLKIEEFRIGGCGEVAGATQMGRIPLTPLTEGGQGDSVADSLSPIKMMHNVIRFFTDIFIGNKILLSSENGYIGFSESVVSYLYNGGQKSFSLFKEARAQAADWCPIGQSVIPSVTTRVVDGEDRLVTKITIIPDDFLLSNSQYRLNFDGVRNKYGIKMADGNIINITTGGIICAIDHVHVIINPTSPVEPTNYDMFNCAGRNDCWDDSSGNQGCQHTYMASAKDNEGRSLTADYSWEETDEDGAIEMADVSGQNNLITANALEDADASVKVSVSGFGSAESSVSIKVFMCENPWPTLQSYPFIDPVYNFSVYYCRDAGEVNETTDDLPRMGNINSICEGDCKGDSLKEYLWVEDDG